MGEVSGEFNTGCKGFLMQPGKESSQAFRGTGTETGKLLGTRSRFSLHPQSLDSC